MFGATQQPKLHIPVFQGEEWILLEVLAANIRDIWYKISFRQEGRLRRQVLECSK
jgi:hypothetical protein